MSSKSSSSTPRPRLPEWLKVRAPGSPRYIELKALMRGQQLHTVCEEAHCPNIGECWNRGTATFMILGDICTRRCHYCAVTTGRPAGVDLQEPNRLAETVQTMGLRYCVITSVNRDDLPRWRRFYLRKLHQPRQGPEPRLPHRGAHPGLRRVLARFAKGARSPP